MRQLAMRGAEFLVMEADGVLIGFVCFELDARKNRVLHYVYVKEALRERGWGRQLLDAAKMRGGFKYTHRTYASNVYLKLNPSNHKPSFCRREAL